MFEDLWDVKISKNCLEIFDPQGNIRSIGLDQITGIAIRTDNTGPIGSDVIWLISDGESIISFPMGAKGEDKVLKAFQMIGGFDNSEFIKAMGSVDHNLFFLLNKVKE
jgi:hypothetical protein